MAVAAAAGPAAAADVGHTHPGMWEARLLAGGRRVKERPHCGRMAAGCLLGREVAADCHQAAAVAAASSFEEAAGVGIPGGPQMPLVGPLPRVGTKRCCPGWVGLQSRGIGCGLRWVGRRGNGVRRAAGVGRHWDVLQRRQVGIQVGSEPWHWRGCLQVRVQGCHPVIRSSMSS